jgi:hypothetical protein
MTALHALAALAIALAIIAGVFVVLRQDPWGQRQTVQQDDEIDPALILYRQTGEIPVGLRAVRALAAGLDGRMYVGGDRTIVIFSPEGKQLSEIALDEEPKCLAIGGEDHEFPGRIYAGMENHVQVLGGDGKPIGSWKPLENTSLTSIAVGPRDVFAADAGNRCVWRFDTSGAIKGQIDGRRGSSNSPGFVISGANFDLAIGDRGLLYVVNPVALQIEAYRFSGDFDSSWGHGSAEIDGFQGCCNPIHIALLPDGRFVTAEKGIPRIKVYNALGKFECVVAGSAEMPSVAADLAADQTGRVLVLDPLKRSVRIFETK